MTVEWAFDRQRACPAKVYYDNLAEADQVKLVAIAKRLAEGQRLNEEKFRALEGVPLFELKPGGHRFLGNFRPGGRFVIANGSKKRKNLLKSEMDAAVRILAEHDDVMRGGKK